MPVEAIRQFAADRAGILRIAAGLAMFLSWGLLYADLLGWLVETLGHDDFRLNLIVFLGLSGLVVKRVGADPGPVLDRLAEGPRGRAAPLALVLGGALGWLAVDFWWDFDIVSASLFGLGTYGLIGLYLPPASWRAGLPAALLLIGALPFGAHLNVYLGFPARVLTAELVQHALTLAGVAVDGAETILVVESRAANVDLPCSGVKSLWTGGLFFLGATWLERRRLGLAWLAVGLAFVGALFAANALRVLAIVTVGSVWAHEKAAAIVHAPLGVLGFVGACGLAWGLLKLTPGLQEERGAAVSERRERRERREPARRTTLAAGLTAAFLLAAAVHTPRPVVATAGSIQDRPFLLPAELNAEPVSLTRQEADLFVRNGAGRVGKWRFEQGGVRGSFLLVYSDSWRAHHPPELCLQGAGLSIDESASFLLRPDFPIRDLSIDGGERSAAYWFQSADRATDDFSSRTWSGIREDEGWVLVSVLLDGPRDPAQPAVRSLYESLYTSVHQSLRGTQ